MGCGLAKCKGVRKSGQCGTIVYYIAEMHMFVHVVFCCFGKLWGIQVSKHPFNTCGVQTHCFVMDNCGCVVLILNS